MPENRLAAWLKKNGRTRSAFAREIGVSAPYMTQLCAAPPVYWPSREVAERILKATDGEITPNDFMREGSA